MSKLSDWIKKQTSSVVKRLDTLTTAVVAGSAGGPPGIAAAVGTALVSRPTGYVAPGRGYFAGGIVAKPGEVGPFSTLAESMAGVVSQEAPPASAPSSAVSSPLAQVEDAARRAAQLTFEAMRTTAPTPPINNQSPQATTVESLGNLLSSFVANFSRTTAPTPAPSSPGTISLEDMERSLGTPPPQGAPAVTRAPAVSPAIIAVVIVAALAFLLRRRA